MLQKVAQCSCAIVLVLCIPITLLAQEQYYYSDYYTSRVSGKTKNQRSFTLSDGQLSFKDQTNGTICFSGTITGTTDTRLADAFISYARNDAPDFQYKDTFADLRGEFILYHTTDKPSEKFVTRNKRLLYSQVWNADGKEMLTNGTGYYSCLSSDKKANAHTVFKDSIVTASYAVRIAQKDTIYGKVDKMAMPHEGLQHFTQELVSTIKYPTLARFVGKEGRAYISFIVDEQGKLTEFEPISNEGYRFETKAVQRLEKFPNWDPATVNGRPVKMRFVLPVVYRLK